MPPFNAERRAQLADSAISLLAENGVHGLTHRAVERHAGLPTGTASNYFPDRESLLVAAAQRILALHEQDIHAASTRHKPARRGRIDQHQLIVDLLTESLLAAATTHRDRYRAIFELQMESSRRPALAATLRQLADSTRAVTEQHHADLRLQIPAKLVPVLMTLYGGVLYTLVVDPAGPPKPAAVRTLVRAVVDGVLA